MREDAWLDPETAVDLCRAFGIPVSPLLHASTASEAASAAKKLGYPVAIKAGSPAFVHKTDVGGVQLGLKDAGSVRRAFKDMQQELGDALGGVVVQAMVEPGIETIVGVTQDPSFGPLVLFGMGGIGAELVRDTALRLLPLTDLDATDLVRELRSSPLLFGYRGRARDRRRRARGPAAAGRAARRRDPRGARARLQPRRRPTRRRRRDRREDPPRADARAPRRRRPPPPRPRLSPRPLAQVEGVKVTRNSIEPRSSTVAGPPLGAPTL